jgi:hypothetical protein
MGKAKGELDSNMTGADEAPYSVRLVLIRSYIYVFIYLFTASRQMLEKYLNSSSTNLFFLNNI